MLEAPLRLRGSGSYAVALGPVHNIMRISVFFSTVCSYYWKLCFVHQVFLYIKSCCFFVHV